MTNPFQKTVRQEDVGSKSDEKVSKQGFPHNAAMRRKHLIFKGKWRALRESNPSLQRERLSS
jgi:hypothetical protein